MTDIKDKEIDIVKLEFPDNVRLRPGKMVGSVDNCDVLLREIIDNAIDEIYGCATCNQVNIYTNKDFIYTVTDNGRGIPIKYDETYNCTKTELAIASVDAGSKFNKDLSNVAVGQNGVGSSAVNALSEYFHIFSKIHEGNYNTSTQEVKSAYETRKSESLYYHLKYEKGINKIEDIVSFNQMTQILGVDVLPNSMTIVQFHPDSDIFGSLKAEIPIDNIKYLRVICKEFYNKLISIRVNGVELESTFEPYEFKFKSSITKDWMDSKREVKFYINFKISNDLHSGDTSGSVNSLNVNRGLHIDMVKNAYFDAMFNIYKIPRNYVYSGLFINIIVLAGEADFSSQTKERLTKLDAFWYEDVRPTLVSEFTKIIKSNKDLFEAHINRIREYINSVTKISTINKVKNMVAMSTSTDQTRLRSKLTKNVSDASSNKREECTLFIVEGDSAGGTILKARNSERDAVFMLRGMPKNSINCSLDELFDNEEMRGLISAIGVGVNEYYDLKNPRYGKVVIATDGDPDGFKIASLILGMIASRMTFLIEKGMIYVLESPLYYQDGKYIYPDESEKLDRSKYFKRFKGLGELNVDEAEYTIINEDTRRLKQITIEGCTDALGLLTSSTYRKQLMIDNGVVIDPYGLGIYS